MTIKINDNDQRLIALFSADIWGEVFNYSPDQARLASVSRAFRSHIETMRGRFLKLISFEPNIQVALKLLSHEERTNSQKVQILARRFIWSSAKVQEIPSHFVKECKKGIDDIFGFACTYKMDRARKLLATGFVSETGIDSALTNSLLAKSKTLVKLLLPRASERLVNRDYLFIQRICAFPEAFKLLLKSNRTFNVGLTLEHLDAQGTALLLQSNRQINQNYYEFPDISDSNKAGLHSALIFAAGADDIAKVKAILTYAKPSKEILQHVRNRIQFYKDHGHLGQPRLAQLTTYSLFDVELENAIYRDQILALLDEAIASHPQIEPADVSDPAFDIPPHRLVPREPAVLPQIDVPEEPEEAPPQPRFPRSGTNQLKPPVGLRDSS